MFRTGKYIMCYCYCRFNSADNKPECLAFNFIWHARCRWKKMMMHT